MEFMYCIPDLELFIDKTIKKCLLEYDLDANDTEAVLDDMEKAWPKTPPKEPEKRDHNGNTDVGRGSRHGIAVPKGAADNSPAGSRIMGAPQQVTQPSSGFEKSRPQDVDDRGQGLANGRRAADGDSDRSGCSSPDGGDGKAPAHKPTKLKSRLQQRYFEASQKIEKERSQSPVEPETQGYTPEHQAGYRPSNLDILASAVNLHTRREEENRLNALKNQHNRGQSVESVTNSTNPEIWQKEDNKTGGRMSSHDQSSDKTGGHMSSQDQSSNQAGGHMSSQDQSSNQTGGHMSPQDHIYKHPLQNQLSHREHHSNSADTLYSNTNNSTFKETVVVRREISRDMKNPSSIFFKNPPSTSYLALPNNLPNSMEYEQRYYPETSRYSFIPNAMSNNPTSEIPKALPQHFQDHSSRIARIIAEELQKDEECPHRSVLLKNAPLVQRINPDEMKPSTLINPPLPESNALNQTQYLHNNERANVSSYLTRAAGSSLPLHNDKSFSIYTKKNNLHEDNQPQDLSLKSKENSVHVTDRRHLTSLLSSPTTSLHSHLTKGYFSSPNSPIVSSSPLNYLEATPQRKSASPTVSTDSRVHCPTESSYQHRATGHWDRKEHVLKKNLVDANLLRDMRRNDALQNWSGARHSELEKRRGNNMQ